MELMYHPTFNNDVNSLSSVIWGAVLSCHAATRNFIGLCTVRVLLGIFESAISPGFSLITSIWYKPSEHASRHSIWFAGNSAGYMTGSLIAYGCAHMSTHPLEPWRVSLRLIVIHSLK